MELSGGNRLTIFRRRSRIGAAVALAAFAGAAMVTGCGGSSSDSDEPSGTREVRVVNSQFPDEQSLGQTTLMKLGVSNEGDDTIPALTFTISVAGKAGESSTLPFGVRDAQQGLAQPDRPVWVLSEGYPKLSDSSATAGAEGAALKTYAFGPLKPGEKTEAVWKLSATRKGYLPPPLLESARAGTSSSRPRPAASPHGSFAATISPDVPTSPSTTRAKSLKSKSRRNPTK